MRTLKIVVVLALVLAAHAQTSRGTVTGTVLDSSGAVIGSARVILTGVDTGVKLSTESNNAGVYRFDAVDLGVYELQIAHSGFRTYVGAGITVEANRVTTVDPRLEVGAAETRIEVNGESSEMLVKDSPLRGGNFQPRDVRDLPLPGLNPLSLTRTLPGATDAAGSTINAGLVNAGAAFSINGQRPRSNNYMLDGTDNNDIWLTGEEQVFTIADAIAEVSVQTGNFSVEFGRAAGGVLNIITKSGANDLHGTLLWRFQSQRFDSVSNLDKLDGIKQAVFSENIFGFTAGGPIRKNKTFFFAGFQQQYDHSTSNNPMQIPTAGAVSQLQALFPNNPRLELYLGALGDLRGTGAPFNVALGSDPQTGVDRGNVQFAAASYAFPAKNDGPQWLGRIDHYQSEAHRLSLRFTYDSLLTLPSPGGSSGGVIGFPGFIKEQAFSHDNAVFTDSYTFGPSYTNEFRFSYERPDGELGTTWPGSVPSAQTLPGTTITAVAAPGLNNSGQFYYGNNYLFQETQTKLTGGHAFRYGVEFLRQNIIEAPAAATVGKITFVPSPGYSAFANFLDDFSGPSAVNAKVFGATPFHPGVLRQSYFFQDNWKATPALALTLGLRYENSGQPANSLTYPAFPGFDPSQFLVRHELHRDNLDFGPAFGLAWSPSSRSGWLGKLFGNGKTVWRGGYQISYDAFFTQLMTTAAVGTPNAINTKITAPNTGRGAPNWFEQLPTSAAAPSLTDSQNALDPNLRNPYTERWSFGFQRQLPQSMLLDVSYVGSESHRLYTPADWNPRLLSGVHLYPNFGQVLVVNNEGNSSYHALQARLDRRLSRGFQLSASYTWSKDIDSISDTSGGLAQSPASANALTSVPISQGGLQLDRGLSDYDRTHRLTIVYLWAIPGPRLGWMRYALGGWSLAGVTTFQSGTPFTVGNGFDRNNDGFSEDRPDIGKVNAPLNTRAIISNNCATGYQNPDTDTLSCVSPSDVHWVQGTGFPNAATVGRNTLHAGGTNNFDLNLTKSIPLRERTRLELRWEAFNAFNHPQFIQVPMMEVLGTPAGRFLNRDFTNSGIRTMWVHAKVVF